MQETITSTVVLQSAMSAHTRAVVVQAHTHAAEND